jgi:hypothetical protein
MSEEEARKSEVANNQPILEVSGKVESVSSSQTVYVDKSQFDSLVGKVTEISNTMREVRANTRRQPWYIRLIDYILSGIVGFVVGLILGPKLPSGVTLLGSTSSKRASKEERGKQNVVPLHRARGEAPRRSLYESSKRTKTRKGELSSPHLLC